MTDNVIKKEAHMDPTDVKLLEAIHEVKEEVGILKSKIDDSVNGRFKDNERRLDNIEANQRWMGLAVLGAVIAAVMKLIFK